MTINVVKFSQFAAINLTNTSNMLVGVTSNSGGTNFKSSFITSWTIAGRPVSPNAGLLGYNTDNEQYEYWNGAAWVSLAAGGSGTVTTGAFNELAFYSINPTGTTVSGLNLVNNAVLTSNSTGVPTWLTAFADNLLISSSSGVPKFSATLPTTLIATKAQQETPTSNVVLVTPSTQQYHPSACLAWGYITGTTINAGYNIASVVANGSGNYTVNFIVPMTSSNYCALSNSFDVSNGGLIPSVRGLTVSSFQAQFVYNGLGTNSNAFMVVCFGQQ